MRCTSPSCWTAPPQARWNVCEVENLLKALTADRVVCLGKCQNDASLLLTSLQACC
jgi:hypothetical protein